MSKNVSNRNTGKSEMSSSRVNFVFKKQNYQLLIAAMAVVIIGFLLMIGSEDIYSFTKITIAPLVVVIGFAIGFIAILYNPKDTSK